MMKLRKISYILTALILTAALTACQQSGLLTNTEGETGKYVTSDEISIPVTKIRNINPATSQDDDVYQMAKLVYNSLIRLGDTMEPVGELAASWQYNESGDLEFTLADGIRWSDGSAFTADDVAFTVRVLKAAGETSAHHAAEESVRYFDHRFQLSDLLLVPVFGHAGFSEQYGGAAHRDGFL